MPDAEIPQQRQRQETSRKRLARLLRKTLVWGIPVFMVIWIAGDFLNSRIVASHVARWESSIPRNSDGVQIGAESRTIAGGPVALLLVHGFNDTPRAFEKMGGLLAQAGFTVRLVRLPGFGVPVEQMKECKWREWTETVRVEAKALGEAHEELFIIGHSLGGAVTIGAILDQPDLADGVVLLAPAVDVSNYRSPLFPTRYWQTIGHWLFLFTTVYESPFDRNDARDPNVRNPVGKPPFSTRNIVQESMGLMDYNRDRASEIRLPLLMVLTRDDRVVDWAASERFFDATSSSFKRICFFDTSGHALPVDHDWPAITQQIVGFLQQVSEQ